MKLYDLRTLHMNAPVTDETPEFSWRISSGEKNTFETSYRLTVSHDGIEDWDSGTVTSRQQAFVRYEGKPLASQTLYTWRVYVADNHGNTACAEAAFETALPEKTAWQAVWVGCPFTRIPTNEYKFGSSYPPVLFEKRFTLREKPVSARVYATACGVYRLYVNGARPDDREMAPEFTPYDRVHYYQTYDVSTLLRAGENVLSMYVGDGWYFSAQAGPVMNAPAKEPAVIAQAEFTYADGTRETVSTDGSETCRQSYIVYSDLYQGEKQDFTLGGFEPVPAEVKNYGYAMLKAQMMPPVRPVRLIAAQRIITTPAGETVVDFGQNVAGRARIHIDLPRGAKAVFEYFEELDGPEII